MNLNLNIIYTIYNMVNATYNKLQCYKSSFKLQASHSFKKFKKKTVEYEKDGYPIQMVYSFIQQRCMGNERVQICKMLLRSELWTFTYVHQMVEVDAVMRETDIIIGLDINKNQWTSERTSVAVPI